MGDNLLFKSTFDLCIVRYACLLDYIQFHEQFSSGNSRSWMMTEAKPCHMMNLEREFMILVWQLQMRYVVL